MVGHGPAIVTGLYSSTRCCQEEQDDEGHEHDTQRGARGGDFLERLGKAVGHGGPPGVGGEVTEGHCGRTMNVYCIG